MTPDHFALPIRQGTRLLNEFNLDCGSFAMAAVGHNLDRVAVFMTILRSALARRGEVHLISGNAISASLGRPLETVRRQLIALVDEGYCSFANRRFALVPDLLDQPRVEAVVGGVTTKFDRLVRKATAIGLLPSDEVLAAPRDRVTTTALDIYLALFDLNESKIPNLVDLYVHGIVAVLNAATITHDPVLAMRYGFARTVPPLELRQPATASAVAARDNFPVVTVRRRLNGLAAAGELQVVPGGYLLGEQWMNSLTTSDRSLERVLHLRRAIARLASDTR